MATTSSFLSGKKACYNSCLLEMKHVIKIIMLNNSCAHMINPPHTRKLKEQARNQ